MRYFQKQSLPRKVLTSLVINTVIALVLTAMGGGRHFLGNLIYSQCIGLSIWTAIDLLGWVLLRDQTAQWRRLFLVVPLGVCIGASVGIYLGDVVAQLAGMAVWSNYTGRVTGTIAFGLMIGTAITYFFLSREQLAKAREHLALASAQAEAAQRHATEAQLKLLETQLEPHMLFNTLSNLRILVGTDPPRAQQMLDHLVAYLRATLGASRASVHPLAAEFDRLNDYLALMAIRMGPRLAFAFDLPDALRAHPVPGLLLQAVVENSIKHGLEPKVEGGHIHISALAEGGQLVLRVQDSGVGLPPGFALDTPAAAAPPGPEHNGFGLAQVRERLQASYGERARLALLPAPGGGTQVTITLPLQP